MGKCCFYVKFVQTDKRTDRWTMVKQYAPDLSIQVHKNAFFFFSLNILKSLLSERYENSWFCETGKKDKLKKNKPKV